MDGASVRVRLVGMVDVGVPLRFVSPPSSAHCRCRKASFSHEFELGGSEQTLQRRLGDIGRILLEGLLQIALEQSAGVIILVKVMEVGEYPFKFAEERRLRIGWHVP